MSSAVQKIKYVVVLMLENRSFDHMLGFLKDQNQEIDGLTGDEYNPADPNYPDRDPIKVIKTKGFDGYTTDPDPGHEYNDVIMQLFGKANVPNPPKTLNNGFFRSYSKVYDQESGGEMLFQKARNIMKCFSPEQLPILTTLAMNFAICDKWFCSVPGPTWPNRFFAHAATSYGHAESPSFREEIESIMDKPIFPMNTIYNNFEEYNKANPTEKIKWRIYHHTTSQAKVLYKLQPYIDTNFASFSQFLNDARNEATMPNYSFIEPNFSAFPGLSAANDQHPPNDLMPGERLIAKIYTAIRGNIDIWNKSLFVILYDEHGGFYDHVYPPYDGCVLSGITINVVNPDGINDTSVDPPFMFDRLGVRVPAILVSPFIPKRTVDHTVYDHTSLLATVKKIFNLPNFLTKRDAAAMTFEKNFKDDICNNGVTLPNV